MLIDFELIVDVQRVVAVVSFLDVGVLIYRQLQSHNISWDGTYR